MKFECCKGTTDGAAGALTCNKCKHSFHVQCLYPTEKRSVTTDFKKSWICPECALKQPKQAKNDNTPIRSTSRSQLQGEDNVNLRRGGSNTASPPCLTPTISEQLIRDIVASEVGKLRDDFRLIVQTILLQELKPIKDEISTIKDSLSVINQSYDTLAKRMDMVDSEIKTFKSVSSDISKLKSSITKLDNESSSSEQWSRRSNVEIYGIPEKKNENLFHILKAVCDRAQCQINPSSDIDFITRVAPQKSDTKKTKPIIIRFLARYKKDEFLSQVRKLKWKPSDIGFETSENSIFFNEHLTRSNKALLQRVKTIAKEKRYTYVWVKNCAIFTRRNDTSPVILISKDLDLNKIK